MRHALPWIAALAAAAALAELPPGFQRGVCIEGGPRIEESHALELAGLGATHVSLNPFGWIAAPDDPEVRMASERAGGPDSRWWGESDEGLLQYGRVARSQDLRVMLRPHLWMSNTTDRRGRTGLWLGDVGFDTPADWQRFFDGYRKLCMHYARLAEAGGMEWYSIGAELTRATLEHPEQWRALIAEVRTVYRGKLLYSANWWKEAEGVAFWDALDAIGVQAYFPVASGPGDSEDAMVDAWRRQLAPLRRMARSVARPVIFTEIGYRDVAQGAVRPWEWTGGGAPAPEVQERAYRAAFRAIAEAPEIEGVYWWKFHVARPRAGWRWFVPRNSTGFTWQGKPAEAVLREAFRAGR